MSFHCLCCIIVHLKEVILIIKNNNIVRKLWSNDLSILIGWSIRSIHRYQLINQNTFVHCHIIPRESYSDSDVGQPHRLRLHSGSISHPSGLLVMHYGPKYSQNPCDFQTDLARFCTNSDLKGKNNFYPTIRVLKIKLQGQKHIYLSTKQICCRPYKCHKPAIVQCHTKLCYILVNI